jgi:cytochrome c biogenesis protein
VIFERRNSGAGRGSAWLEGLASPRLAVAFFLLTAASVLVVAYELATPTATMAAPFALLVVNVGAALVVHRRFRADLPLLLFHLALLALVALVALARLVYMTGTVTLTSGTAFDGQLLTEKRGPLHVGRLAELHFANDGFVEDRAARHRLHATYNRVRWQDEAGQWHPGQIGDDRPLLLKGYKIYTSDHRGFSPLLLWRTAGGADEYGSVQLSDQLDGAIAPAMKFSLPDGTDAWAMLDFETTDQAPVKTRAGLGSQALPHTLVLRIGDARHVLRPGQQLALPGGTLTYVQLDSWMGYLLSYDPTRPWIMATVMIGIVSLVWFYWQRLFGRGPAPVAT